MTYTIPKPEQDSVEEVLKAIGHPFLAGDLLDSGAVKEISSSDENSVLIQIDLGNDRKVQLSVEAQIRTALAKQNNSIGKKYKIKFIKDPTAHSQPSPQADSATMPPSVPPPPPRRELKNIKHIIAIGSGKGGVGKSTVALNLAVSLANQGHRVGVLDADIYGPSLGKLAGFESNTNLKVKDNRIIPEEKYSLKFMSFSFLLDESQAVVWRGPMLAKAVEQFIFDTEWKELDYLVVDLPPGTGDVQLSLSQLIEVDGAVIVTTPQSVATQDARRAIQMFKQVNIPVVGIIENMSHFVCPHCNEATHIFSHGGGSALGQEVQNQLLGQIPLTLELMESCEKGIPITSKQSKKLKLNSENITMVQTAFQTCSEQIEKFISQAK